MLSYGTKNLPKDFSIEKWAEQSKKFLIDTFGKENVTSAMLHMDEGTLHIHAIIFPIVNRKLSARSYLEGRQAMRDLHVKYHEYTKECGLEAENRYILIDHSKQQCFTATSIWLLKNLEDKDIAWHCGAKSYKHPECRNSIFYG